MDLKNFEEYIEDVILARGLQYFKNGHVESLELEDGKWVACVFGSEEYTVTVGLDDNGIIIDSTCDCPYDFGEFCKHQVAVFYALRHKKPSNSSKTAKAVKPKADLKELLSLQDKTTLVNLLLEMAARDEQVKRDLQLRFAQSKDVSSTARQRIRASIRKASRGGFVDYRAVGDAAEGAERVLQSAGDNSAHDAEAQVKLYIVVLEEMMDLLQNCDDSDGIVGSVINEAIALISDVAERCGGKESGRRLFDLIFQHAKSSIYKGWSDWEFDLIGACLPLCATAEIRKKLEQYLEENASAPALNHSDSYRREEVQRFQYGLIERFEGEDAAEAFLEKHLENSDFRKKAIDKAMARRDYDRALALCLDGEKASEGYAGLVNNFKQRRYAIYEKQNDVLSQRELALEFIKNGDYSYYGSYKQLIVPEEWPLKLREMLKYLSQAGYRQQRVYLKILIEENLKEPLLEYAKQHPGDITGLYPYLLPEFRNDVDAIFKPVILHTAKLASDRKRYKDVCRLIREYAKACGADGAKEVRQLLLQAYPKRPAFVDELGKIKI